MKVFALAASLRKESLHKKLISAARTAAVSHGAEVALADFRDFTMPLFDSDLHEKNGLPHGAQALADRISAADAVLLASPEYNFSMPGHLKNAIDWLSRIHPTVPLAQKPIFLLSTSPGPVGGIRGLWQLRVPLEGLGAYVHPTMYYLPFGAEHVGSSGTLADPAKQEKLSTQIRDFLKTAQALNQLHNEASHAARPR